MRSSPLKIAKVLLTGYCILGLVWAEHLLRLTLQFGEPLSPLDLGLASFLGCLLVSGLSKNDCHKEGIIATLLAAIGVVGLANWEAGNELRFFAMSTSLTPLVCAGLGAVGAHLGSRLTLGKKALRTMCAATVVGATCAHFVLLCWVVSAHSVLFSILCTVLLLVTPAITGAVVQSHCRQRIESAFAAGLACLTTVVTVAAIAMGTRDAEAVFFTLTVISLIAFVLAIPGIGAARRSAAKQVPTPLPCAVAVKPM